MSDTLDLGMNYRELPPGLGPALDPIDIDLDQDVPNSVSIQLPDGSVEINFGPPETKRENSKFDDNLAEDLSPIDLGSIAEDLIRLIEQDDSSRTQWVENRARGIDLLGLEIKTPGVTAGGSSDGISKVDHPMLLEAVLRFQANARAELLPTDGPVKVRNDGLGTSLNQELADALEKDLNHFLTSVAKEYYPDTDRLLFMTGFGGIGFKKGYHCPIKRRPVIASIDANDLIVSNASTSLDGAGRITHRVKMAPSTMKRMQLLGQYRDIVLSSTAGMTVNPVDSKVNQVQGIAPQQSLYPEEQDRELYECYCELDIPGFEHKEKGKETGLPIPYKVVIDKESRHVLEIRRNWDEDDDMYLPKTRIVAYIFVPGLGFYAIGLLNILGNATKAVTAAWREMLDAGMFANFPGFLYLKSLGKQLTNEFRVPPGGGMPIDGNGNDITKMIMPLPYKEPGQATMALISNIVETGQRVGGTAELQVGEGKQDAPVGTTLALIEQATKVMSAVHKRLHTAQGEEFAILKELLTEDPGALWRHNKKSEVLALLTKQAGLSGVADQQEKAEEACHKLFIAALNCCNLVPAADPNTHSQTERYLKTTAMMQLVAGDPAFNQTEAKLRSLKILGIDDAESLRAPQQAAAAPDPKAIDAMAKLKMAGVKEGELAFKAQHSQGELANDQAERESKERVAGVKFQTEQVIHAQDAQKEAHKAEAELAGDHIKAAAQRDHDQMRHITGLASDHMKDEAQRRHDMEKARAGLVSDHVKQVRQHAHEHNLAAIPPQPKGTKQ